MSLLAFILILVSALMHVTWNLIAKKRQMSLLFFTELVTVSMLVWLHVQFWTPVKVHQLPPGFWGVLTASLMSDVLYSSGLIMAYRKLEMSTAYPLMRSLPILFTALLTSLFGLGRPLPLHAVSGFLIVFAGALIVPLNKLSDFSWKSYFNRGILFVILVALGTTGYTIFDSQAMAYMRSANEGVDKTVLSITYYSTRALCLSLVMWSIVLCRKASRAELKDVWKKRDFSPLAAGLAVSFNYIFVITAMNYVTNVSYVQVFRQIGLPIGMFAGILILKERSTWLKITGVFLILAGLALSVWK